MNTTGQEKDSTRAEMETAGRKERYQIEALAQAKWKASEIAKQLGYSKRTIERELARGTVTQMTSEYKHVRRYWCGCGDAGQRVHEMWAHNKGRGLKIGYNHAQVQAVTHLIAQEHYALDTALAKYRKQTVTKASICTKTLYHYIEWGLLAGIELNGCENLNMAGTEKLLFTKIPRTKIYYAHPYSAYERGSNEVANCMIRRFVPKGTDIGRLSNRDVKRIERWMNDYPYRKLGYLSAYETSSFGKLFSLGCIN